MNAETIARALSGRRIGGTWTACCPAHEDRTPSLAIRDADHGKVLVRCHAGCDQERVIAALRGRGLWPNNGCRPVSLKARERSPVEHKRDPENTSRTEAALAIWGSAKRAQGTLVEVYLASRGIRLPAPDGLRFHPGLRHPSGGIWPAMVALMTTGADGRPIAIHRTFLARDGGKAPVSPQKMMLGPCRGGSVRLGQPDDLLLIAEGIETALSVMQATGHPAWAALSTSGLRALDLPGSVRDVIVLADGDDPGEAAAREAAWRWSREGRRVRIARPPPGLDFNDMLLRRPACIEAGCNGR